MKTLIRGLILFVLAFSALLIVRSLHADQVGTPCNSTFWDHVHSPRRFYVASHCVSVRGIVVSKARNYYDGDYRLEMLLTPESYADLQKIDRAMYSRLMKKQRGLLLVEIICAVPHIKKICGNFKNQLPLPEAGDQAELSGPYVRDGHKRIEIHGPSGIKLFSLKTLRTIVRGLTHYS